VSSTMLELAISMIFLYLMLSAASSAIQEIIANWRRWRAKTLEKGIAGLFNEDFKDKLYQLPLIESLCSPNARGQLIHKPSYIPSATFALAVLDLALKNNIALPGSPAPPAAAPVPPPAANAAPPEGAAAAAANSLSPESIAKTTQLLISLLLGAQNVQEQRKRIEDWFNDSMDRVSGWYKRTSHAWLWIIGIVLCLIVNADSISLFKVFWNDPTLRAATVAAADEHVKNAPKEERTPAAPSASGSTAATGGTAPTQPANSGDTAFKRLNDVRQELTKLNIPLGWCWQDEGQYKRCFPLANGGVTFTVVGKPGETSYNYWIVSNYADKPSTLAGPFAAEGAPAALTDTDYVTITWQAVTGAKTYDVLRSEKGAPTGACDCAVAKGVASTTANDKSEHLKGYKLTTLTKTEEEPFGEPVVTISKPGAKTYNYWFIPHYGDVLGHPAGPFAAKTLDIPSAASTVTLSWKPQKDATQYDVLRTPDDKLPTGECRCAVKLTAPVPVSSDGSFTITDNSPWLEAYTYGTVLRTQDTAPPDSRLVGSGFMWWLLKFVGLAITALAISQGAPFWFDLLQKVVNLRLAGDAPNEKQAAK
jgi:hypothetical protein